jgi:hypothetical protein
VFLCERYACVRLGGVTVAIAVVPCEGGGEAVRELDDPGRERVVWESCSA